MELNQAERTQLADVQRPVEEDLRSVKREFERALSSDIPIINEVGSHLLSMGGKRLRPTLLLLIAQLGEADYEERIQSATAVELIHTATLVHDDVIDQSEVRRGGPTVNARWNDRVSLMMGDYIYSKAFVLMAESGLAEMKDILAVTTHRMSVGEMMELEQMGRLDITEPEYTTMVGEKTASLFGAACRMGGILGGADDTERRSWGAFGENLGLAFQIIDDIFDFVGHERVLGKPIGSDLREGHATLPLIEALERAPSVERSELLGLISRGEHLDGRWDEVVSFVHRHGGISHARERAAHYVTTARESLVAGPAAPARQSLHLAVDYIIDRVR